MASLDSPLHNMPHAIASGGVKHASQSNTPDVALTYGATHHYCGGHVQYDGKYDGDREANFFSCRSAVATETQAMYARKQFYWSVAAFWVSVGGAALLVWTLRETRRSAKAAEEAVLNTIRAERPFLLPINARLTPREDRTCVDIKFDLTNYGKGIGIFVRHTCEINVSGVEPFRPLKDLVRPISPGAELKQNACMGYFDLPKHISSMKETEKIIISGVIVYQGAFKKLWSASYQFEYVPSAPADANLVWRDGGWSEQESDMDEKIKDG